MDPLAKLTSGFKQFRDGRFQEQRATYEELVDRGQHPKVALIACSDSRVDPAIVLQADPGDLFIVRNVANLVPPFERTGRYHGTSAALEFAVEHLQVGHVIVLGHAHCGGIRALFKEPLQKSENEAGEKEGAYEFVAPWMSLVRSAFLRVEGTMPNATEEVKAKACEQAAVLVSLENLMTFPFVSARVGQGRLQLHGWYFDIRTCELQTYDPPTQAFKPVE